ncbi:pullulanase-type alpha-1,6-glucosidase [Anaerolineales bacterium HSG25]|nr:pullulanase-type alpha-1,6-glucosidase [Anaerolineales bacterium HSG25]
MLLFLPSAQAWSGVGHFVTESIGYTDGTHARTYTAAPNFRQASGSLNAAQSSIGANEAADVYINFDEDTSGKSVYVVYTTDGTAPIKTNGSEVSAAFSKESGNESDSNRTWYATIPAQSAGVTVNYVFYISNSTLANAWGRISGTTANRDTSQYETSWTESDNVYFSYTIPAAPADTPTHTPTSTPTNTPIPTATTAPVGNADIFESYIIVDSGSGDTYYDAKATTINTDFDSHDFGTMTVSDTLTLSGGEVKTFKNSGGNVTSATMQYRLYLTSGSGGSFIGVDLPWNSDLSGTCPDPCNQKWLTTNVNLLSGLATGSYTLEIYFEAATSVGTKYSNNGGDNYKATFTVVEPTATATPTSTGSVPTATNTPTPTNTPIPFSGDDNIHWNELYHNAPTSYNPDTETIPDMGGVTFRAGHVGGTIYQTSTVEIYMLTLANDLTSANLLWNTGGSDTTSAMVFTQQITASFHGQASQIYDVWRGTISPQSAGTTVYYRLQAVDQNASAYLKSSAVFANLLGQHVKSPDDAGNNYQYTVYNPASTSTLGFVGDMFPAGGFTTHAPKGAPVDVYVQVYKSGVTDSAGAGAGISCELRWGEVNSFGTAWLSTNTVSMSYNGDMGNNDEYTATFTPPYPDQPTISKKYEFTAFCDDGTPAKEQNAGNGQLLALNHTTFVHMFEWKWTDIAQECEEYLGPKGFGAVQVSPANEHALIAKDPNPSSIAIYPWWQRYQPVSYKIESRSGTRAEFADMVSRCNAVGVQVYADAVINHMANTTGIDSSSGLGTGSAGTQYQHYSYPTTPGNYGSSDFHDCNGQAGTAANWINDYADADNVQECELNGLSDLKTEDAAVQAKIIAYLNDLLSLGVTGLRIDAAKHMQPSDIEAILAGLNRDVYVFNEVIGNPGEAVQTSQYLHMSDVSEFQYSKDLNNIFRGNNGQKLADVKNGSTLFARHWSGYLNSNKAMIFTDNHDNQRGHGGGPLLSYRDGQLYVLANIFMMSWPYGYPDLMSSYTIPEPLNTSGHDAVGPPSDSSGNTYSVFGPDVQCSGLDNPQQGNWVCEHRHTAIGNMVGWRNYTADSYSVDNWWTNGNNQIAYSRGDRGFVVINRENSSLSHQFTTGLVDGIYCNVVDGSLVSNSCTGSVVVVTGGQANISVAGMDAVAIHGGAKMSGGTIVDVGVTINSSPKPAMPNQAIAYTIIVTNNDAAAVTSLSISDLIPAVINNPTWTCQASTGSSCSTANGSGNISLNVDLATNGQATILVNGTVDQNANATIVNMVSLTLPSGVIDSGMGNNTASDSNTPSAGGSGPSHVTVVGDFQSDLGCTDWQADCVNSQFVFMGNGVWRAELTVPAGSWEYKAVLDNDWANGSYPSGGNNGFTVANSQAVRFYYDSKTNAVWDNVSGKVAVATGSFQSELGCVANLSAEGGDWEPSCVRSIMTDINNDGLYVFQVANLPAGNYELKVALNESWATTYPAQNVEFAVNYGSELVTIGWNSTTNDVWVNPSRQRALWLDQETIAWNPTQSGPYQLYYEESPPEHVEGGSSTGLLGGLDVLAGGSATSSTSGIINLTDAGTVNVANYPKFPNVSGYKALKISAGDLSKIPDILKGQIMVVAAAGSEVEATGVQIQGVLDDLYSYNGDLGVSYNNGAPSLGLWAPTAKSVTLHRYADSTTTSVVTQAMSLDSSTGVWRISGDSSWDKQFYKYEVEVYAPTTGQVMRNLVSDPYAVSLSVNPLVNGEPGNTQRSQFVDLYNDATLKPSGWDTLAKPALAAPEDISVYETHVRDFSISDQTVSAGNRGTFMAFTEQNSNGMKHLVDLAQAGLTHIHLLPAADSGVMVEQKSDQQDPGDLSGYASDGTEQQAAIQPIVDQDGFNWGYETQHYGAPEGAYSTNPDGPQRVLEFREMVKSLNGQGLRVVLDVVYNHTYRAEQNAGSVLDKVVPGYYQRYDNDGDLQYQSCCPDTAMEFDMMEKLMVDTVLIWAKAYKVDSFRFDLMNFHLVSNIQNLRSKLDSLNMANDGVDGPKVYVYGEGWSFGSALTKGFNGQYADKYNMAGTGIGTFNDHLRDAVHGGYSDSFKQGFINGLFFDSNGKSSSNQGELRYAMDRIRIGLAGSLQNYQFTDQTGNLILAKDLNGQGYTLDPQETINYISKHDNETLYDLNIFKLPSGTSMADRVRSQNVGLSIVGLSQGIPFFHLASDMLRSKSLDRDSYNSGDHFNRVDFTYQSNNFGVGLPPSWRNDPNTRWPIMQPFLADASLKPAQADIMNGVEHFKEMLQIRSSSKLFRLETEAEINSRVQFHNTGSNQKDGLIVMSLSDKVGADLDPNHKLIVVLINANDEQQTFLSSFSGLSLSLHSVQVNSHDAIVKTASFDSGTGQFTIPARTTVVFVEEQASSDLSMSLDGSPEPMVAGTTVNYTLVVSNSGAGEAIGAVISDTWPNLNNVSWTCTTSAGATCQDGSGTLNDTVNLPSGAVINYNVTGQLTESSSGTISNWAETWLAGTVVASATTVNNINQQADLEIVNISNPSPGVPGQVITYTVTVRNNGPSNAQQAVVVNNFPADVTGVTWTCSAQTTGAACGQSSSSGNIYDTINLPIGGTIVYLAVGQLSAGVTDPVTDTATVDPPPNTTDPNPDDNSSTDTTAPKADLIISKTSQPVPFLPGQTATYTLVVSNAGPNKVTQATVSDMVPSEISAVSWTCQASSGASCTGSGSGNLNDSAVNLLVGGRVTYTLSGLVSSGITQTITNTATVNVPTSMSDPIIKNNQASDQNEPPRADLSISLTSQPELFVSGARISYTIQVDNFGPHDVMGVVVEQQHNLPLSDLSWTCSAINEATCGVSSGTTWVSSTVDLPSGSQAVYLLTGRLNATATGTAINTATVIAPSGVRDMVTSNNQAVSQKTLQPQADLQISLSSQPNPATRGESVSYTVIVKNAGPSVAQGAFVSTNIPLSGALNISQTVDLAVGGEVQFTISGTLDAASTGMLQASAEVVPPSGVPDSQTSNNFASEINTPTDLIDLIIGQTISPNSVGVGDTVTITLTVSNTGLNIATGIEITNTLPDGLQVELSQVNSVGTCVKTESKIRCSLTELAGSSQSQVSMVGTATLPGAWVNTAVVTSSSDTNLTNNQSTASLTISGADLALTYRSQPAIVEVGQPFSYSLSVTNHGPNTVNGAQVSVTLPDGVSLTSAGENCQAEGTLITCLVESLTVSQTVNMAIQATAVETGSWSSVAEVSATSPTDPNLTNNTVTATTQIVMAVENGVDLVVTQQAEPIPVMVGQMLSYTITVTNQGSTAVKSVRLTDILPSGVQFMSAPSDCQGTDTLVCELGSLDPGAVRQVMLVVTAMQTGLISNTVLVSSAGNADMELTPSDNQSTLVTSVGTAQVMVNPTEVQTLALSNGMVSIPAQAVSETIQLVYTELSTPTQEVGSLSFVGQAISLNVYRNDTLLSDYVFIAPITISLSYSDSQIIGLQESSLSIYYLDPSTNTWLDASTTCTPASTIVRDPVANRVEVAVCHLTNFALRGESESIQPIYLPVVVK